MEYIWKGAEGLSGTLEKTLRFTVVYAVQLCSLGAVRLTGQKPLILSRV